MSNTARPFEKGELGTDDEKSEGGFSVPSQAEGFEVVGVVSSYSWDSIDGAVGDEGMAHCPDV